MVNGPSHGARRCSAVQPADFKPIEGFVYHTQHLQYLLLGQLEQLLEAGQPEERHVFRPRRRLEEHLVTATVTWFWIRLML